MWYWHFEADSEKFPCSYMPLHWVGQQTYWACSEITSKSEADILNFYATTHNHHATDCGFTFEICLFYNSQSLPEDPVNTSHTSASFCRKHLVIPNLNTRELKHHTCKPPAVMGYSSNSVGCGTQLRLQLGCSERVRNVAPAGVSQIPKASVPVPGEDLHWPPVQSMHIKITQGMALASL